MEKNNKRLAVLVGCNYPKTQNELHGCINDVLAMRDALVKYFNFDRGNIKLLIDDAPGSSLLPTGANIKKALYDMVDRAEPGDGLFFHYSGHGTLIPSLKRGHPFRKDEAIVPCDFNLITDMDFRDLVNRVPKGTSFTMLSDSCHSGGLIDKEKEQIGPSFSPTKNGTLLLSSSKPKSISPESLLHHLSTLTNINTTDIATHLLELFGPDASLRFRLPPPGPNNNDQVGLLAPIRQDAGILLSGCQKNETSADISAAAEDHEDGGGQGKAHGAFSNAVQMVVEESHNGSNDKLSNKEIVMLARKVLEAQGLGGSQHPCLYCSDENADAEFLG